jgi:hypothetical protein
MTKVILSPRFIKDITMLFADTPRKIFIPSSEVMVLKSMLMGKCVEAFSEIQNISIDIP